jgi:pilus assembly protein CpaE
MPKELNLAIEISRSETASALQSHIRTLSGVKVQQWTSSLAEKGGLAVKTAPDIIVIDESPESGNLLNRLRTIKDNFPQASLFVVSANRDPQNIIDAMKAGASEYLVEPLDGRVLLNAIEEVRARLASSGRLAQGNVYSFISAKGGIGATALAVNTGAALALAKKGAVTLIDLSLQSGDASVLLDVVPQRTVLDICQNIHRLDVALLRGVMFTHNTGLNFLAAPQNPEDADEIHSEHVAKILDLVRRLYDNIIIDCPSMQINECTIEVLRRSDKVFVVTDMSVPSIRNAVRLIKLIRKLGIGKERVEVILNRFVKNNPLSVEEIEKTLDKPLYWMVPNEVFAEMISCINRGVPLVKQSPAAIFSRNINQMIQKFQNQLDEPKFRGIRGLFGKSL